MKSFPNGIGGSTGDTLATATQFHTTGDVWYVHFGTGTDAASPAGKQRNAPLKTLSQAQINAADYDVVVLLSGHAETFTTVLSITKRLRIIGEGTFGTASMPSITLNAASGIMLALDVGRIQLRNIRFPPKTQANGSSKVSIGPSGTVADIKIIGCYFEGGATDTGRLLSSPGASANCDRLLVKDCTFISTSTTTQPLMGLGLGSSGALADVAVEGCTFDGGTVGWSNQYALDASTSAITNITIESCNLLRDSDIGIHASSTGHVQVGTTSGSARVVHS